LLTGGQAQTAARAAPGDRRNARHRRIREELMFALLKTSSLALAAAALMLPAGALAQAYPEKPVTVVISGQVGGTIDTLARQLAPFWEKHLGQPLVIDNRSGAAGVTGVRHFLEQPQDGYTILVGTEAHYSASMEKDPNLKSTDIELINMHQFDPAAITVLQTSRFKTLEDIVNEAKAKPDSITWGSPPTGAPALVGALVSKNWDLTLRFIPQAGGVESDTALLGGHVDFKVGTATGDSRELPGAKVLAVAAPERLAFLPDVPTINEVGARLGLSEVPNFGSARLIITHASLKAEHPEIFDKLAVSYKAAIEDPDYVKLLTDSGQLDFLTFYEPARATELFRALVEDTIRYKAELGQQ
jgi:tripartite-type tricarboxylate transporter receptor subunit TctC